MGSDSVEVAYELHGPAEGPPVMLAHSLGDSRGLWGPQVAALRERFRLICYDSRGHGASPAPQAEYSLAQLGADALALMDRLGLRSVSFCGLSLGGLVGMWLATHAPDRIARLALANTSARLGTPEGWQERIDLVRASGLADVASSAPERWFTSGFRARDAAAVERATQTLLATPAHGYAGCCAALRDADLRDAVKRIEVPMLVIGGRHDPVTTAATTRRLAEAVPGARYVELDAAHLSNVEQPVVFTNALLDLLEPR